MQPNLLYAYVTALSLSISATSVMGQVTETTSYKYVQVMPATSFDFTNPFGLTFGRTTCAELAASLQQATWETSPDGGTLKGVLYDSQWYGWISAINSCFNPYDTIENLDVVFIPVQTKQPNGSEIRELLSTFANRLTTKGSDWKILYKNPSDPVAPRVVAYNPSATVSLKTERDFLSISFRSHRFSPSRQAEISRASVRPVGVAVGISTCHEASVELDGQPSLKRSEHTSVFQGASIKIAMDKIEVNARYPGRLYPGATSIEAVCDDMDDKVETLYIGVKDGPNNSSAREAYRVLASKYKLVEGTLIPKEGVGYARFETSGVTIELKAWGDGQDFLVTYMESQVFENIKKFRDQKRRAL